MFPELPLPPLPILTRWSSWLEAAKFYAENFNEVKSVLFLSCVFLLLL
jgi:hypothetical protein